MYDLVEIPECKRTLVNNIVYNLTSYKFNKTILICTDVQPNLLENYPSQKRHWYSSHECDAKTKTVIRVTNSISAIL